MIHRLSEIINDEEPDTRIMGQAVVFECIGAIPASCITAYRLSPKYEYQSKDDLVRYVPGDND